MIKATFITIIWVFALSTLLPAQKNTLKSFCATLPEKSPWLENFQQNRPLSLRNTELIYLPVAVHLVETDEGLNSLPESKILEAFCTLNEHFRPLNIQFFLQYPILYLRNSSYYDHTDPAVALQMIQKSSIPGVINTFFVKNAADACGYTLRNQAGLALGIALSAECTGGNTSSWAHEMGHFFSLPHTFHGWETYMHDYNLPAPTIVGKIPVEKVDQTNCRTSGDGFCDTAPDYLNGRWQCNEESLSEITQKDPNGIVFRSDGSNLMSYASDPCSASFSTEQQTAMRLYIVQNLPGLISRNLAIATLTRAEIMLTQPGMKEVLTSADSVVFAWQPVQGIAGWVIEVSPIPSFKVLTYSAVTSNTTTTIPLSPGKTYFWRVWAFNQFNTCKYISGTGTFSTASVTGLADVWPDQRMKVYPNPLTASTGYLTFSFDAAQPLNSQLVLHDALGKTHWTGAWNMRVGTNTLDIPVARLAPGTYFLRLLAGQEVLVQKIIIQPSS